MSVDAQPVVALRGSDFAALSREVRAAGLLERRPGPTLRRLALRAGLVALAVYLYIRVGNSWWQLAIAALFAFVLGQLAFAGHDAGHFQLFPTRRANRALGFLHADVLVGLSFEWWVAKHTRHHQSPNEVGRDPDIADGVIAWTGRQMGARTGLGRRLSRHQAAYFFPLLLLEGFNLKVSSVIALARSKRSRRLEISLLLIHLVGFVLALCLVLPFGKAVLFALVEECLFGFYLGCSFAPNHTGMAIHEEDESEDFLRRQVMTARNVRGGRITSFVFGGLNHQIEHHLFPSMPSQNLRRCGTLVRSFCARTGVPYVESGLLDSYRQVLTALRHASGTTNPTSATTTTRP